MKNMRTDNKEKFIKNRNNQKQDKKNKQGNGGSSLSASKTPVCPYEKKCGGCQYQGMPYERQLKKKQERTEKLLKPFCTVYPITGMEKPYHYRNKVHSVFDRLKNGTVISGVYEEGTHRVVPVTSCLIEDEKADAVINDIR